MARIASAFKQTMCSLVSLPLANSHFLKCHRQTRSPQMASLFFSSLDRIVLLASRPKERNHQSQSRQKPQGTRKSQSPGPPRCQWGRLERQDRPEWLLAINRLNKNGLYLASLRPFQNILSVSPTCGLLRIRMAWSFSVKATQMEAKTAEVFKAALLCFVAQSHLTLCDPWTGARLPPLLACVIFHMVVPTIRWARAFYVFQRRGN